jgi:hypothetical protein
MDSWRDLRGVSVGGVLELLLEDGLLLSSLLFLLGAEFAPVANKATSSKRMMVRIPIS